MAVGFNTNQLTSMSSAFGRAETRVTHFPASVHGDEWFNVNATITGTGMASTDLHLTRAGLIALRDQADAALAAADAKAQAA